MKKIFVSLLCLVFINIFVSSMVFAIEEVESNSGVEHVNLPKRLAKKSPTNVVQKTENGYNLLQYNTLEVVFAQNFDGKTAKIGDEVAFLLKDGITTEEGSQVVPASTKLVAVVSGVELPKSFNRCGKIHLDFKYMELPDGKTYPIEAKIFNKDEYLSRGKLNTLVKGFGNTFATSAVGTAAGCGIGVAANAVVLGGMAIGLPIGATVGSFAGFVTPGLNYRAKAGEKVNIQLISNIKIEK